MLPPEEGTKTRHWKRKRELGGGGVERLPTTLGEKSPRRFDGSSALEGERKLSYLGRKN